MSSKNILLIMPYGSVGGMERLALNFYNYYKAIGYDVKSLKFIKLSNDIINFGEDELFFKPYDFAVMSKTERILFYLKAPYLIRKIIQKYNITHSIAFGDMANLFSSLSFSKEYKIGSIHALKSVELKHITSFTSLTRFGYKSCYRFLDKLVCISKAIKEDLIENCGYPFSNLEVIYNPHDVENILTLSVEPIDDVKEIEIFSNPTILFLGRLSIQKAPWHLINAFHIVNSKHNNINLVFIGDGDANVLDYITSQIKRLDLDSRVFFLGRRSNPYKYIKASNVLALSSHYEGTPNVIVESIAIGTPIVSSFCTKGIVELMSLNDCFETGHNIVLESGIITPNLFKGTLGIPQNNNTLQEEQDLAKALIQVIENVNFKVSLKKVQTQLLAKFNLVSIANQYIS